MECVCVCGVRVRGVRVCGVRVLGLGLGLRVHPTVLSRGLVAAACFALCRRSVSSWLPRYTPTIEPRS